MSSLPLSERALQAALRAALRVPGPILRGPTRHNRRGDPLDPEVQTLLALDRRFRPPKKDPTVAQARAALLSSVRIVGGPVRAVAWTQDLGADGVPVRVYAPARAAPLPALLYAHGGGWCVGDLASHDASCRRLAADGGQIVVAVDYRRAPEHPCPAGQRDVLTAWRWLRGNAAAIGADPERLAIGGDSAGGNLAAAACLHLRDAGEPQPAFQLLVYPATDLRCVSESYQEFAEGYLLTADSIQWYLRHYGADPHDPRVSVLLEPDLRGLAPAILATASFDPLRDDGEGYASRLRAAGIQVEEHRMRGLVHGFFGMDRSLHGCDVASGRIVESARRRWAGERGSRAGGEEADGPLGVGGVASVGRV